MNDPYIFQLNLNEVSDNQERSLAIWVFPQKIFNKVCYEKEITPY